MKTNTTVVGATLMVAITLLAGGCKRDAAIKPVAVKVTDVIPVSITHVGTNFVTITNLVALTNTVVLTNTVAVNVAVVTVTNTINMTVTNVVTKTNVVTLTNAVAAPATGTGSTNAQIGVVQQAIPLPPGPSFNTNGVVDGLPCLFINKGRKPLTCYLQGGGGRITLNLAPGTRTFNLLPGKYSYDWAFDKGPNLAGGEFSVAKEATHFVDGHGACHGGVEFREE